MFVRLYHRTTPAATAARSSASASSAAPTCGPVALPLQKERHRICSRIWYEVDEWVVQYKATVRPTATRSARYAAVPAMRIVVATCRGRVGTCHYRPIQTLGTPKLLGA